MHLIAAIVLAALVLLPQAAAAADPASTAEHAPSYGWQEIESPRTRVLFEDPRLEQYARRVAVLAEHALDELAALFGELPAPIVITLDGDTDVYSAVAPPLPRPRVSLPALFPTPAEVDLRIADPLYGLLLHELTHTVALAYSALPPGESGIPRLGLVGETVAPVPPGWFLEGLAVWVAATRAPGASLADARSRGLLDALALEGDWPSLADVSLLSHEQWPGGEARYLLGGEFVGFLVDRFGWETLLEVLREVNAGWQLLPFEAAFRTVTGAELGDLWREWEESVRRRAAERAPEVARSPSGAIRAGPASTALALAPGGDRLAWRPVSGGLRLAELDDGQPVSSRELLPGDVWPVELAWWGEDRLLFTRIVAEWNGRYSDLFELDPASGEVRRLTHGERVRSPRSDARGCVLYLREVVTEPSSLRRLCPHGRPQEVFRAAAGEHLVGLAVSPGGLVALSLWRRGRVDLLRLEAGGSHWLTGDSAQDLDPHWLDDETLLFRSDRTEVFELYTLRVGEERVRRLTGTLGGVSSLSTAGDLVAYSTLTGDGHELVIAPLTAWREVPLAELPLVVEPPPPGDQRPGAAYPLRPYRPWPSLVPFGWLPEVALFGPAPAAAVTILGQDDSGDHSYALSGGYHPGLDGPFGGGWLRLRYDYRKVDVFDLFQRTDPLRLGVQFGVWPHAPHLGRTRMAMGGLAELTLRAPLGAWVGSARLSAGALRLGDAGALLPDGRLDALVSRRRNDLWGYGVSGPRLSVHALWSAAPGGASAGAWLDGSIVGPPSPDLPLYTEFRLRAGYRPPPGLPLTLHPWSVGASAAFRHSLPLRWRVADGILALERLTVELRGHAWFDGDGVVAADLSLWGDAMVRYGAPVSLGGTVGYAEGWWFSLGLRLPL